MKDITFIIPIKIDTNDRMENCSTILRFLSLFFPESEVLIIEIDGFSKVSELRQLYPSFSFYLVKRDDFFSRSLATNKGIELSTRSIICIYDADILLDPKAIVNAVDIIKRGYFPIVLPYNGLVLDVKKNLRRKIISTLEFDDFSKFKSFLSVPKDYDISTRWTQGGIMLADKQTLVIEGGYNQNMISYGWEDSECAERFKKLGCYYLYLKDYNLIHLDHERGVDSKPNDKYFDNKKEYEKVRKMSRKVLRRYVDVELNPFEVNKEIKSKIRKKRKIKNLISFQPLPFYYKKFSTYSNVNGGVLKMLKAKNII